MHTIDTDGLAQLLFSLKQASENWSHQDLCHSNTIYYRMRSQDHSIYYRTRTKRSLWWTPLNAYLPSVAYHVGNHWDKVNLIMNGSCDWIDKCNLVYWLWFVPLSLFGLVNVLRAPHLASRLTSDGKIPIAWSSKLSPPAIKYLLTILR